MNKEDVRLLANKLMFDVSDNEAEDILNEFNKFDEMLSIFDDINTDNVEEMIYPIEDETSFLREDEENIVLSQKDSLKNAGKVISGHVVVPKVVK